MTIAAGFRCFDGVLLATDSEHSLRQTKFSAQKIWPVECGDFVSGPQPNSSFLLIVGAGADDPIQDVVNALREDKEIRADSIGFVNIENAIKRCFSGIETSVLLAGLKIRTERRARLLKISKEEEMVRIIPFGSGSGNSCAFIGTEVAESICREITDWLYSDGLPVLGMNELAKHILGRIIDHSLYCRPPVQTNYLFDTGCAELAKQARLPDYANGYLGGVQYCVGHVIGSCVDANVTNERFEHLLKILIDKLRAVRSAAIS
jgi:hypothetical protein